MQYTVYTRGLSGPNLEIKGSVRFSKKRAHFSQPHSPHHVWEAKKIFDFQDSKMLISTFLTENKIKNIYSFLLKTVVEILKEMFILSRFVEIQIDYITVNIEENCFGF